MRYLKIKQFKINNMTQEEIIESSERLTKAKELSSEIKEGNYIMKSFETIDRNRQGFSIGKSFNYSSNSFYLTEEEWEILKTVNSSLLQSFINKRKIELEKL